MKKTRFSGAQITGILKGQEQGLKVANICRKQGISDAMFCNWKSKYAGMSVDETSALRPPRSGSSHESQKTATISPGTVQNLRVNATLPFTKIGE